ncbi:chorismate mutase [Halalkalibacter urbisdiaboli]|uniref:chorismate mutase n=1 Tax=Halalkalibacter urbisdiaboli TaxID=1960589 RepID=UPI000B42F470|nr:chorismate mutase [Halalkalibacter urbisdiaboli]
MIRGIRGAITITEDNEQEVLDATEELLRAIIKENEIEAEQVAQVLMTVTDDIKAAFPAKAMRRFPEWSFVPVTCAQEIPVKGSLPLCVRVLMTINTDKRQADIKHIYLKDAQKLRPDLSLTRESKSS